MQYFKFKVVVVGGIGKIFFFESIFEFQQWEDVGEEQKNEDFVRLESLFNLVLYEDYVFKIIDIGEEKILEDNFYLFSRRLSVDVGINKKKCLNVSIEMLVLIIEEKIEREK